MFSHSTPLLWDSRDDDGRDDPQEKLLPLNNEYQYHGNAHSFIDADSVSDLSAIMPDTSDDEDDNEAPSSCNVLSHVNHRRPLVWEADSHSVSILEDECDSVLDNHENMIQDGIPEDDTTSRNDSAQFNTSKGKRKQKVFSATSIDNAMRKSCGCSRQCHELLTYDLVLRWRNKYHTLPMGPSQQTRLIELYKMTVSQEGYRQTTHLVEGLPICKRAWFGNLLAVSERTYYRAKQTAKEKTNVVHRLDEKSTLGLRGNVALGYMRYYVSLVGDQSPEKDRIIMPIGLGVKDIYKKYTTFYLHPIKPSRFYQIWKDNMQHVSYQRNFRISKCNVCFRARRLLEQNNTPEAHAKVIRDRDEHLEKQQKERQSYYERRARAIANPTERTSIIIDGMDQKKTDLPHFKGWSYPKDCDPANMLQTHIVGVEVHGKAINMIVDYLQWPHDSNLTLSCMLLALRNQAQHGRLTRYLDIQLDNCARENKNKYFIGLVALMVRLELVEVVTMNFLMVGHTHEDIDGRFSRISVQLNKQDAVTLPQLLSVIGTSLANGAMQGINLPCVFDIKNWLLPVLNEVHNQSFPHAYKIFKDREDHVAVHYKHWSTDQDWQPQPDSAPLEIFRTDVLGRQKLPEGGPDIIEPSLEGRQDFTAVARNIEKLRRCMKETDCQWWDNFLENPHTTIGGQRTDWYLDQLLPWHDASASENNDEPGNELISPLAISMTRERNMPQVYTGPRRTNPSVTNSARNQCLDGYMVAVVEQEELYIGEIRAVMDDVVRLRLFSGTINTTWKPFIDCNNHDRIKTFQKSSIKEDLIFRLTKSSKLPQNIKDLTKQYF